VKLCAPARLGGGDPAHRSKCKPVEHSLVSDLLGGMRRGTHFEWAGRLARIPEARDPMLDPARDPTCDPTCDPCSEGHDWDLSEPEELPAEMTRWCSVVSSEFAVMSSALSPIVDRPAFFSLELCLSSCLGFSMARPEIGHFNGVFLSYFESDWFLEPSIAAWIAIKGHESAILMVCTFYFFTSPESGFIMSLKKN
jgi:hypothetical protein